MQYTQSFKDIIFIQISNSHQITLNTQNGCSKTYCIIIWWTEEVVLYTVDDEFPDTQ